MLGLSRISRCSFCRLLVYHARRIKDQPTQRLDRLLPTINPALRNVSTSCTLNKKIDESDSISTDQTAGQKSVQEKVDAYKDVQVKEDVDKDVQEASELSSSSSDSSDESSSDSESDSDVESGEIGDSQPSEQDKEAAERSREPSRILSDDFFEKLKQSESAQGPVIKKVVKSLDKEIATAAKSVAETLPGDAGQTEADLIGQLLSQYKTTEEQKAGISSKPPTDHKKKEEAIVDLMKGFKKRRSQPSRSIRDTDMESEGFRSEIDHSHKKPTGLFTGKPLGIFKRTDEPSTEEPSLFEIVAEERRQRRALAYPPRNAFEEQIQWTLEGKMWTFPIDNEAGWEEEQSRGFHEHVFLEDQLEGFPNKGPIRHFMELVTTALSKNPYLTVAQKHEHIDWFRQYFIDKVDVLEDRLGQAGLVQEVEERTST